MDVPQRIHKAAAFAITLAVAFALVAAPFSARAQETADATGGNGVPTTDATPGNDATGDPTPGSTSAEAKSGNVTVEFLDTAGNKLTTREGGKIELYRVATLDSSNGTARFDFAKGDFAGSQNIKEIASMTEKELMDQSEKISASLAAELVEGTIKPFATAVIGSSEARFASVPEGLYLVCQGVTANGDKIMAPFLVSVPDEDGSYDVVARPKPVTDQGEDTDTDDKDKKDGSSNSSSSSSSSNSSSSSSVPTSSDVIHTDQTGRTIIEPGNGTGGRAPTSATADASPLWTPVLACGLVGIAAGAYLTRQRDES